MVRGIAFITSPLCAGHRTPPGHPEQPARVTRVEDHLASTPVGASLVRIDARKAAEEDLLRVHDSRHVEEVRDGCARGGMLDEGDTFAVPASWEAGLAAAGALLDGVDAVRSGAPGAFCCTRPPGHHAERDRPMGFCLFNNAAVGVRYAQERYGLERVAVLDWDVHHGNGTQHIFEEDPSVLYCSLHQFPFYPGTGARQERGVGKGMGATVNVPLPAGSGEGEYLAAFREQILPPLRRFRPELLVVSAGFDAHRDDPLGGMRLTDRSFGLFTRMVRDIAPVVSVLEGGYNLDALARSVEAHLIALLPDENAYGGAS
jgi:acetoin utilization deacetylase AcuC-like enzyme